MSDAAEIQLQITGVRGQEDVVAECDMGTSRADATAAAPPPVSSKRLRWWAVVLANIVVVLGGQSVATLLGGGGLWLTGPSLTEPSERWRRQSSARAGLDGRLSPSAAGCVEKRGEEKK
ncbi:Os09g0334401 [Oryza sativa Japonica Group]|uniref:Os09g0334401 protein n=1 Tax=Oryza sativa subsp. japonica TaxID=39947 RepID=A0A0P0XL60_ORYSJ|nr:Os09g0334401 [Oryza sativa Japonica Group]